MGTLRSAGIIRQSDKGPYVIAQPARPNRLTDSAGAIKQMDHLDTIGAGEYLSVSHQAVAADGDIFEIPIIARGNETRLCLSHMSESVCGNFDIYINDNLEPVWSTIDTSGKFYLYTDVGAVWADDTVDAGDAGAGDVDLLPAAEAINDAAYFGWGGKFRGIRVDIGTPGVGDTGVWEYYNGAAWATLTCTDGTSGFTAAAGNHDVTFTPPSDWATVDPGAASTETLYYIRFRVTAANFTTIPILDQVWIEGGYCDYAGAAAIIDRYITLTNSVNPGYNLIEIIVNGKHYSATNYYIEQGGLSLQ